jgi:hypothetical protein
VISTAGSPSADGTAGTGLKRSGMRSGTAVMKVKRVGGGAGAAILLTTLPPCWDCPEISDIKAKI